MSKRLPRRVEALKTALLANYEEKKTYSPRELAVRETWYQLNRLNCGRCSLVKDLPNDFWRPTNLHDKDQTLAEMRGLVPVLHYIDKGDEVGGWTWNAIRNFISVAPHDVGSGHYTRFLVRDDPTGKLLGIIALNNDTASIGVRDQTIGWTREDRFQGKMLRHIAVATTIVPTPPIAKHFLGVKLLVALLLSDPVVREVWEASTTQQDVLAGITTTSLWGNADRLTAYDGIPGWDRLPGETMGKVLLKPDWHIYQPLHQWIKTTDEYQKTIAARHNEHGPRSGIKEATLALILKYLGLPATMFWHHHKRGVYFGRFFENTDAFLRREIGRDALVPKTPQATLEWWRDRAVRRYLQLRGQGRLEPATTFYHDMIGMSLRKALRLYAA